VIHHVMATHLLFSPLDIIEAWSDPYIKTFSTLSGVRLSFWISSQLDILCTFFADTVLKLTIHCSCVTCFPMHKSSQKQTKSSATAKSTARPSCLVGVLWHLSGDNQQINS